MAKKSSHSQKQSYMSVPSQIINSLSPSSLKFLLVLPKKFSRNHYHYKCFSCLPTYRNPKLWSIAIFLLGFMGLLKVGLNLDPLISFLPYPCSKTQSLISFLPYPCSKTQSPSLNSYRHPQSLSVSAATEDVQKSGVLEVIKPEDKEGDGGAESFWKQPDGMGYRPCLDFSQEYRKESVGVVNERSKYLMVGVNGGMSQQRNQIVDAVVIARILGAVLVVPNLEVNVIWGDESEFSDIFDLEHFKSVLANDVHVVSMLPSTHLMRRPVEERPPTTQQVSHNWIRARYLKKLRRETVLLIRGFDSWLSKDLPSDLQKLRCKVAFNALRFARPILELGNKLAERMQSKGPYLALHLRMEKDVWVRTGCLPGLGQEYDEMVNDQRKRRPELLTERSNMSYHDRKLAGLCPLNAYQVSMFLKALGAPRNARIYWAGGKPLGGKEALRPLTREFSYFYNKEDLALPAELEPFVNRASSMAAIDYIVCERSDVFMLSHGGNMGHAILGHRAYAGHKKSLSPNKREILRYFLNSTVPESEFNRIIMERHRNSLGQPEIRMAGRDLTTYPIPECMCNDSHSQSHIKVKKFLSSDSA